MDRESIQETFDGCVADYFKHHCKIAEDNIRKDIRIGVYISLIVLLLFAVMLTWWWNWVTPQYYWIKLIIMAVFTILALLIIYKLIKDTDLLR